MALPVGTLPLLETPVARPAGGAADPEVLADLADLAFGETSSNLLSARLHALVAGHLGKPGAARILLGVQELMHRGDAAGARFLAAFLEVSTPGARLVPKVQRFSSCRRLKIDLEADSRPSNPFQAEWLRRVGQVSRESTDLLSALGALPASAPERAGREAPWPAWRRCFLNFLEDIVAGRDLMSDSRLLMAEMIRLEADAWQERTGNLAGTVNPYNAAAVRRVLPLLSKTDSLVQDLHQLVRWIGSGDDRAAFTNRVSSALEVMDPRDHDRLRTLISETPGLNTLAALSQGLYTAPLEVPRLAAAVAALLALGRQLVLAGARSGDLDVLTCVRLVQENRRGDKVQFEVGADLAGLLSGILAGPVHQDGLSLWPLEGFRLAGGILELDLSLRRLPDPWENFLPTAEDRHPRAAASPSGLEEPRQEVEEEETADLTASAIKHLVMSNLMSTSVTLGFLRNPKVTSIPGLVAEVAARTRNPQIIETIATDRALFTGFANRDVPRICLMSPCNTSVKTLRKFIHVKYVNKVDLRRMANDRAGMRRDVIREIEKYLEALA